MYRLVRGFQKMFFFLSIIFILLLLVFLKILLVFISYHYILYF
jgi:hypothetical protein